MRRAATEKVGTATAVVLLLLTLGCSHAGPAGSLTEIEGGRPEAAAKLSGLARDALASGDAPAAVSFAELLVQSTPRDLDARLLLGRAYMRAGRFQSAADVYADALVLWNDNESLGLNYGLALLAGGRREPAIRALERLAGDASLAGDVGLALALAGDMPRGINLLQAATRQPAATARERQNLALALALSGEWDQARHIAAQDLTPEALVDQAVSWSRIAAAGNAAARTAMILGATPLPNDGGMPTMLALAAPLSPQPVETADQAPVAPSAAPTPVIARLSLVSHAPAHIVSRPVATRQATWVVQLGAYAHLAGLEAGWERVTRDNALLRRFEPNHSEINVGARGVRLQRLSVGAFPAQIEAIRLCATLRRQGYDCYVRRGGDETPVASLARTGGRPA